jgi:hypothetical protein
MASRKKYKTLKELADAAAVVQMALFGEIVFG